MPISVLEGEGHFQVVFNSFMPAVPAVRPCKLIILAALSCAACRLDVLTLLHDCP